MNSSCSQTELKPSSECDNSEANEPNDVTLNSGRIEEIEKHPIIIDAFDAGGQVLRIANALSFLTKKPIRVQNIRQRRGLRAIHAHQVDMAVTMSNGRAEGNEEGSIEYTLWPSSDPIIKMKFSFYTYSEDNDFLTTFQAVLPCFVFGKETSALSWCGVELILSSCPSNIVYFCQSILRPVLKRFGVNFDVVASPYEIEATIEPVKELKSVTMTSWDGGIKEIRATIFHSGSYNRTALRACAEEFERDCIRILKEVFETETEILIRCETTYRIKDRTSFPNSSIILEIVASDECILSGEKHSWIPLWNYDYEISNSIDVAIVRKLALDGKRAYDKGVCVRGHLTDQILLFMALAKGTSTIRSDYPLPDDHWKKAISVIEEILNVKFSVRFDSKEEFVDISCEGIGMQNENF